MTSKRSENHMEEPRKDILDFLKKQGFLNEKTRLQDNDSLSEPGIIDSITLLQLIDFLEGK